MRTLIFALLLGGLAFPAIAYDDYRVGINLAEDYADCALYYQYAINEAKNSNREDIAKELEPTANSATTIYLMFMKDKTDKQIKANLDFHKMKFEKIMKEEGFDRLIVTYADFCKAILEDPKPRIKYWQDMN